MSATDRERLTAQQAAQQATQLKFRLIHVRPSGSVLLVSLAAPDGTLHLIRAETADAPGLEVLPADDRSKIVGAFLCMRMQHVGPDAA